MAPGSNKLRRDSRPSPSLTSPQAIVKVEVHQCEEPEDPKEIPEPGQEFGIHKAFLCHYSPCLAREFKDTEKKVLHIYDTSPEAFGTFVHWLYYQDLNSLDPEYEFCRLCEVWELAHSFQVPALQIQIMDVLYETAEDGDVTLGWLIKEECKSQKVFDIATRAFSNGLRRLLRDIMTTTEEPMVIDEMCRYASKEMIVYAFHKRVLSEFEGYVAKLGPASDYYADGPDPATETDPESVESEELEDIYL